MILSDPAQKTKYDLSIRDSIDDNESTAGGEVTAPVIVETSGGSQPRSIKTSVGSRQPDQNRRKQINWLLFVIGGLVSCITLAVGYWLLGASIIPPEKKVATGKPEVVTPEGAVEPRVKPVNKNGSSRVLVASIGKLLRATSVA